MAKKSQIDLAIEQLEAKRTTASVKFLAGDEALQAAIAALRHQNVKRTRKPKAVAGPVSGAPA